MVRSEKEHVSGSFVLHFSYTNLIGGHEPIRYRECENFLLEVPVDILQGSKHMHLKNKGNQGRFVVTRPLIHIFTLQ